jgi:uncharacterized protein with von Willebrand factor type A (vWA) domain
MKVQDRIEARRAAASRLIREDFAPATAKELARPDVTDDDLVYQVSKWHDLLYRDERKGNKQLVQNEVAGADRASRFGDFQRELFTRVYANTPRKLKQPAEGSEWAQKLHGLAGDLPEFKQLQSRCRGDELWSGMATASLGKTLITKMEPRESNEDIDKLRERLEELERMKKQGIDVEGRISKALEKLAKAEQQAEDLAAGLDPTVIRNALRKVCTEAAKEIDDTEQQIAALSFGSDPGTPQMRKNLQETRDLAAKLKAHPKLQRIAREAGRMRRIAVQKQRAKSEHARSEITSIEQGSDVDRLLPSELGGLSEGGDQEMLFYKRLADRQALQYKLEGKEKEGRGPICALLDTSGSMAGSPEVLSKAACLGLLDIARREKRTASLTQFDTIVQHEIVFRGGKINAEELLEALAHFTGGGTNFQPALERAVAIIKTDKGFKKADILLITDGISRTTEKFDEEFIKFKKEWGVTVYTILVGGANEVVDKWTDHVFRMSELLDGTATERFEETLYGM